MLLPVVLLFVLVQKPLVCVPDHINWPAEDTKCVMLEKMPPVPKHEVWDACWLMISETVGKPETIRHYYQCDWDSYHWFPESWDVVKDFMTREKEGIETEHVIAHWGVSFKEEVSTAGDCGYGFYKVTYHNIAHIKEMPEFRYENLTVWNGDCGEKAGFGITLESIKK